MRRKKLRKIATATLTLLATCTNAATFFVSPNGNDNNNGSKNAPFATLQRAQKAVRTAPKGNKRQVVLQKGTYRLKRPLVFTEKDSGTKTAPVVFRADKAAEVFISGDVAISSRKVKKVTNPQISNRLVSEVKDKIFVVDLKSMNLPAYGEFGPRGFARPYLPSANELFINGKAQSIAQWPNHGQKAVKIGKIHDKGSVPRQGDYSNRGGTFEWNHIRPARWSKADDLYLSGLFQWGYADDTVKVAKIDSGKKTFTTVQPHLYGFGNSRPWNTWTAKNLLEEIDIPGEYYLDKKNHKLYFYPPVSLKEIKTITLSIQDKPLVSLMGASYLQFRGITFENSRGMGVYIENGQKCLIKDCTFRNLGIVAVNIGKGTKAGKILKHDTLDQPISGGIGSLYSTLYNNTTMNREGGYAHGVVNCKIYDTGAGGIILGGGDRKTLKPAGNFVRNCEIFRFNRLDRTYKSAINIDGVGNKIQHCLIYEAPGTAILLHGNNHIIEYNEIHHVMMDGDDQGAYYLGRDPSEFGNITRFNYFHDIGISPTTHSTWSIYYDDGSCGNLAYGNVFRRAGKGGAFLIGGGSYNKVFNNIFIDCGLGIHIDNRLQGWGKGMVKRDGIYDIRLNAVNFNKPPYSTIYPELANYWKENPAEPKNLIENNLFYNCDRQVDRQFKTTIWRDNWSTKEDPGFADLKGANFELKKDAKVFKKIKAFRPIPFGKMGLVKENKSRKTPCR